jgi:hypothetical protein
VWDQNAIAERKGLIEAAGLRWSAVESLPVSEAIKLGDGDLEPLFANYRESIRNLAAQGVDCICYNFMPVLDWTRTQLAVPVAGGGSALRFNAHEHAAFDCFTLQRPGAEADHSPDVLARARVWFDQASESQKDKLLATIMAGLPGAYQRYDVPGLRQALDAYKGITPDDPARPPRRLPASGDPDRRRGRRAPVHPSRRSTAPAVRPATHRFQPGRHRLPVGRRRYTRKRTNALHRVAGCGGRQRPARYRPPFRQPHAFRASP